MRTGTFFHDSNWLSPKAISYIGRVGYVAKGIVYGLFGLLATRAALVGHGRPQDAESTFAVISQQPFGKFLLVGVAAGLLAFVAWRFLQVFVDPEIKGGDFAAWIKRIGCGISAFLYLGLAITATSGALGTWGNGSSNQAKTAIVLGLPGGQFMVAAFGLGVIGVGAYHFYRVHQASFMQSYDTSAMSQTEKAWAERIGRFGLGSRGIVFLILGVFLVQAALQYDPSEVGGLGKALDSLSRRTYGTILFLIVALGFVAYGAYCFSRARYKQFVKHESR